MGISEILKLEQENTGIFLHKEGIFWRIYEVSAYLFVKHIKEYRVTKKYFKNAKQEVVYMGFPQNIFSGIEKICNEKKLTVQKGEKQIRITGFESINNTDFDNWKISIEQVSSQNKLPNSSIIERIRNFPVISKSPIECQQFLIEIQGEINGKLY